MAITPLLRRAGTREAVQENGRAGAGDSLLQVDPGGFEVSGILPPLLFPSLLPFPGPLLPRHRASVLTPFSVVFSQAWDTLWLKCFPGVFQVSQETCWKAHSINASRRALPWPQCGWGLGPGHRATWTV